MWRKNRQTRYMRYTKSRVISYIVLLSHATGVLHHAGPMRAFGHFSGLRVANTHVVIDKGMPLITLHTMRPAGRIVCIWYY